jgi:hypothetical protein
MITTSATINAVMSGVLTISASTAEDMSTVPTAKMSAESASIAVLASSSIRRDGTDLALGGREASRRRIL